MPTRAVDNLTASVKNPATDTDATSQLNAFVDRAVEQARGTAPPPGPAARALPANPAPRSPA